MAITKHENARGRDYILAFSFRCKKQRKFEGVRMFRSTPCLIWPVLAILTGWPLGNPFLT